MFQKRQSPNSATACSVGSVMWPDKDFPRSWHFGKQIFFTHGWDCSPWAKFSSSHQSFCIFQLFCKVQVLTVRSGHYRSLQTSLLTGEVPLGPTETSRSENQLDDCDTQLLFIFKACFRISLYSRRCSQMNFNIPFSSSRLMCFFFCT